MTSVNGIEIPRIVGNSMLENTLWRWGYHRFSRLSSKTQVVTQIIWQHFYLSSPIPACGISSDRDEISHHSTTPPLLRTLTIVCTMPRSWKSPVMVLPQTIDYGLLGIPSLLEMIPIQSLWKINNVGHSICREGLQLWLPNQYLWDIEELEQETRMLSSRMFQTQTWFVRWGIWCFHAQSKQGILLV